MGLYDREYMRDANDVARRPHERSRRRQLITLTTWAEIERLDILGGIGL